MSQRGSVPALQERICEPCTGLFRLTHGSTAAHRMCALALLLGSAWQAGGQPVLPSLHAISQPPMFPNVLPASPLHRERFCWKLIRLPNKTNKQTMQSHNPPPLQMHLPLCPLSGRPVLSKKDATTAKKRRRNKQFACNLKTPMLPNVLASLLNRERIH